MRKPNGYGSIKHLSGNRRRPFVFVVSQSGHQHPVEYFATQTEAEIFAADYNKIHRHTSLAGHRETLSEVYCRWRAAHIADTEPSASTITSYANSWRYLEPLGPEPISFPVMAGTIIEYPPDVTNVKALLNVSGYLIRRPAPLYLPHCLKPYG